MKKSIMYLFARTPVHVGAGNSVGAVDSPVMRERHTRIPIIPGSSLKGVLSDLWNEVDGDKIIRSEEGKALFGEDEGGTKKDGEEIKAKAGKLSIGEARVLAFPVRSAKGMFAWITCPLVLNRYARDAGVDFDALPELGEMDCLAGGGVCDSEKVVLEEYVLCVKGGVQSCAAKLKEILQSNSLWQSVDEHLVILSNTLFSYFVENACSVVTRNRIDDETGAAVKGGLFSQEEVPSETLFYANIASADDEIALKLGKGVAAVNGVLQVGGNETIGLGFCDVEVK
ncbi:MAG: type III-B CRISPR module RAMP protein Cmr4 [Kiritimatiellia bacterium]